MREQSPRLCLEIIYETEANQFLSEKLERQEGVIYITLTSCSSFVAKNLIVYGQKAISR